MSAKRSYSRYFIILQEDEKGYSTDNNKFPTGYAKVERKNDKCKVSYYVQNLKKNKEPYYMVLICDRKTDKRLVNLGAINIDDYGRAEIAYEYNVESVANSNIPMENIKGAAIVRMNPSSVNGVLCGFVSGVKLEDWKSYAIIDSKERSNVSKDEVDSKNQSNTKEEKKIQEESTDDINESVDLGENNAFDEYEKNIENAKNINIKIDRNSNDEEFSEDKINEDEINDDVDVRDEIEEIEETLSREDSDYILEEVDDETEFDEEQDDRHKKKKDKDCNKDKHDNKKDNNKESNKDKYDNKKDDNKDCNKDKHDNKKDDNKESNKDKCDNKKDDNKESNKDKHDNKKDDNKDKYDEDDIEDLEEFFEDLVDGFEEVKEICPELGKCKWYKIDSKELENIKPNIEFNKYTMVYYPMFSYHPYIRRRGHYLMGHKCDSKGKVRYIVYAIPGTKNIQDQPFGGATGFVTWVSRSHSEKDKNIGYWVMFYDFKNSTVVVPVKK